MLKIKSSTCLVSHYPGIMSWFNFESFPGINGHFFPVRSANDHFI